MMLLVDWLTAELDLSDEQAVAVVAQAFRKGKSLQGIIENLIGYPLSSELDSRLKFLQRFEWGIRYRVEVLNPEAEEILADQVLYLIDTLLPMRLCQLHRMIPISMASFPSSFSCFSPVVRVVMVNPDDIHAEDTLRYQIRRHGCDFQRLVILPEDYERLITAYANEQTLRAQRQALQRSFEADLSLKEERQALQKAYEIEIRIVHAQSKELVARLRCLQRLELKIIYGLPCVEIDWEDGISGLVFDLIETLIPLKVCQEYQIIPIAKLRNGIPSVVQVAMVDPDDLHAQNIIEICLKPNKLVLQRLVITSGDFKQAINEYVKHQDSKRQGNL